MKIVRTDFRNFQPYKGKYVVEFIYNFLSLQTDNYKL